MYSPHHRLAVSVEILGSAKIAKESFPLRYGKYSLIRTADHEFGFNLNGEIKFIRGLSPNWPHPAEQEINSTFTNVEITGNFLIGTTLSAEHHNALLELLGSAPETAKAKGAIYLSPVKDSPKKRELLPQFYEIKVRSRLSTYMYLIQRL